MVYCLYKQLSAGNNFRFITRLPHNSVKWIKRWQIHIGMAAFRNFFKVYVFATRKKWYDLSGWKIYVAPIIRTRINDADTKGRLTGHLGRGSSWATTLGADWRVPWDEVLREPRHLEQTDESLGMANLSLALTLWAHWLVLGTRLSLSSNTWCRLTWLFSSCDSSYINHTHLDRSTYRRHVK